MPSARVRILAVTIAALALPGCEYLRLFRPTVIEQLDPDVARLVNYLPDVDDPNEAIVARLFAHGGLAHAEVGDDGVMRARVRVPKQELIWKPAILVMPRGGELEVDFYNEDQDIHMAFMPSNGERRLLLLPARTAGRVRIRLDQPGLYWFGCPVSNHAGRGMLGLVIVEGPTPPGGRLHRPRQPKPH